MSVSLSPARHLLVIGGYGVVGTAVVDLMTKTPGWQLTTAARRSPPASLLDGSPAPAHIRVDLLDAASTQQAFADLASVTDLVFCAYSERESMAASVAPNLAMLDHSLKALGQAGAKLQQVVLIGGGKSYGEHLGPYKTPAKESDPRFMGPIFYNDQEDLLWRTAEREGFAWTVLRPDGVMGPSLNSPMNILTGIASFAAISQALRLPLRFPGSLEAWTALHQATDSRVLAEAVLWALTTANARQQVFNVTNGDHFRWQQLWPQIAGFFGLDSAAPQPMNLGVQMADKAPLWAAIVDAHDLRQTPLEQIAAWPFVDGWLNAGYDMVQSTIKIRQAGFSGCIDSHQSVLEQLQRLRDYRLIP
ncbi:SDR family oxidoreductase [Pseudomonas sp. Fl5BN2]|uniref:SDR family oxidoreductase n=1 Tax=Pseudomonas sp. Fl5BN2 TaxID=2697652 RepID=UPI0021142CE9|nr:SDR family oxidoreductase [Pseudomonas sp. Fl5BN2]